MYPDSLAMKLPRKISSADQLGEHPSWILRCDLPLRYFQLLTRVVEEGMTALIAGEV
jgi:hypothetical protein